MMNYKLTPLYVSDKDAFFEASKEELRALVALFEKDGIIESADELARAAKISKARAAASLVLWEEAGVITPTDGSPSITEEFEARLEAGEIKEISAVDAAKSIRSDALSDMISECAAMLGRATLNTTEIKNLTALHEQYSLSPEYILTLAAYMSEKGTLNITRLINKAIKLTEKDIFEVGALEEYIKERESDSEAEREFRKIFGIFGRALSKTEKEAFKRWSKDYGYFTDIVGEAYDIAVINATRGHLKYADKLLTAWHESGCRTLAECKSKYEADEALKKAAKEQQKLEKTKAQKPKKERYGTFDIDDAFARALERSYGKKN